MKVIEIINDKKQIFENIKSECTRLLDLKERVIEQTVQDGLPAIFERYQIPVLQKSGIEVSAYAGISFKGKGNSVRLNISYESYRSKDKETFHPELVSVHLSTAGYGWRNSSNQSTEEALHELNGISIAAEDTITLVDWLSSVDYIKLMEELLINAQSAQETHHHLYENEIKNLDLAWDLTLNETIEEIIDSLKSGDNMDQLVPAKSANVHHLGCSVSAEALFESRNYSTDVIRVVYKYEPHCHIKDRCSNIPVEDVRKAIKTSLIY